MIPVGTTRNTVIFKMGRIQSTSRVTDRFKRKTYLQATFDDLEVVVMEKNTALYGDAFND